ncbi:MAG: ferrous iron transport protein B [bacterium]|jgi:ferrous iron transport protein B
MAHNHCSQKEDLVFPPGRKVVLVGNPNVGKSVFFNYLTGMYVDVSNYPGTTLEIAHGKVGEDVIIDTPGVYGISSFTDEERIARDIILDAGVVLNVVNAVHLERDLFLTQQVIDTGIPVVVALNMVDEARREGIAVDVGELSRLLGVPVVETVAIQGTGLAEVKAALEKATGGRPTPGLPPALAELEEKVGNRGEALLILEGDPVVAQRHGLLPGGEQESIYAARRERVNQILAAVVSEVEAGASFTTRLSRWMIRPLTGIPILALALLVMYWGIGYFVAQTVVEFLEGDIMGGIYEPAVRQLVARFISPDSVLGIILTGEFGLLTMTVTYVVGLLLPLVVAFYFFLSLFEDSGYLPRVATLVDRLLTGIGLNGRAIIPLILGFGCVTMAVITTRLLGSDRERRIAIFLLGLVIPCSAQLGVIAALLAAVGPVYAAVYILVIVSVLVMAGTLLNTFIPGKSTALLIDLPTLRWPRLGNVLKKTVTKSHHFIREATPLFALGALIINVLQLTGALELIQNAVTPVTVGWLGLPREAATVFIMGVIRRDFGAAGLSTMALTPFQTLVGLVTITLFVPCIASIMILFKERSKKEALLMWLGTWVIAFITGGLLNQLARVRLPGGGMEPNFVLVVLAFLLLVLGSILLSRRMRLGTVVEGGNAK